MSSKVAHSEFCEGEHAALMLAIKRHARLSKQQGFSQSCLQGKANTLEDA